MAPVNLATLYVFISTHIHRGAMVNWIVHYLCSLGRDSSACIDGGRVCERSGLAKSGQLIPDVVLLVCGTLHLTTAPRQIGTADGTTQLLDVAHGVCV